MSTLRIATRKSPLALWQAEYVKQRLQALHEGLEIEIVGMTTQGDELLDRSLAKAGGKGLFLKELQVSLLNGETDIAVHSMKDVPVEAPEGLEISVVCEREDPRDAFVSNNYQNLYALPQGGRVGTSSLRRITQLKNAFPKLEFLPLRGNVNTRLGKLDDDQYDAIILAAAGLIRLGLEHRIKQFITPELCLPAVGQGIVGVECRSSDKQTQVLLAPLHDRESAIRLAAERAMNATLQGGCQVPVAGFAEIRKGKVRMRGMVADSDGRKLIFSNRLSESLSIASATELGAGVGQHLLAQGAGELLAEFDAAPTARQAPRRASVILTRQRSYRGNMSELLEQLGCDVHSIETLQIDPIITDAVVRQVKNLKTFTDLLFVSRNAVELGMALLADEGISIPASLNVMAVGAETAKQLRGFGIKAVFPDKGTGAEALLSAANLRDLSGRRVLIFRGLNGLDWPAEEMAKRGAQVEQANIYQQALPEQAKAQFAELLSKSEKIDAVFIHSAQSGSNFMQLVEQNSPRFAGCRLIVGSQRIADTIHQLGWHGEVTIAESPSNKHMLEAFTHSTSPSA